MTTSTRLLEEQRRKRGRNASLLATLAVPMWHNGRCAAPCTLPRRTIGLAAPLKACTRQSLRNQRRGAHKGAIRSSAGCDCDGAPDPVLRQRIGGRAHVAVHARFRLGRARQLAAAVWHAQGVSLGRVSPRV
jgi:hypothetical protein